MMILNHPVGVAAIFGDYMCTRAAASACVGCEWVVICLQGRTGELGEAATKIYPRFLQKGIGR